MAQPRPFPGLSGVRERYDVLLCDVWGVIHNGREHFPEPCAALARWKAEVGPVVLISNAPRPSHAVVSQLDGLGVPRESWSAFVTSGDATRALLAERAPAAVWRIGRDIDEPLYEGLNLTDAGPADCDFVSVTGPEDDEVETAEDYRDRLAIAAARGVTLICANPDRVVHRGDKLITCGGALADVYAELGGPVLMAGKPYAPIYDLAVAEARRLLKDRRAVEPAPLPLEGGGAGEGVAAERSSSAAPMASDQRKASHSTLTERLPPPSPALPPSREKGALDPTRVLCIGDGLQTDVAGANAQHLDCLFVTAGIHAAELRDETGRPDPTRAGDLLAREGVHATWAAQTLAW